MKPLLRVRHLTTTFATDHGVARAVDDVSFDVTAGETLGLVGESGCGKTVTALSILRLLQEPPARIEPRSQVEYQGRDISQLSHRALREIRGGEIAMIFQEPTTSLNPVLNIGTQIVETICAHRDFSKRAAEQEAEELLRLVGIPDPGIRLRTFPHELSGGMQQRAMIAMALSCKPKVLIADEPTTALDVTVQAQIIDLLTDLQRQLGMAIILITHDLGVVAGLADRVVVMYGGRIVEEAPTNRLFATPAHPYTEGLLGAAPRLDRVSAALTVIPGVVPPAFAWPSGCRFHPRCQHAWERCRRHEPMPLPVETEHEARCWLIEEPEHRAP